MAVSTRWQLDSIDNADDLDATEKGSFIDAKPAPTEAAAVSGADYASKEAPVQAPD